MRLDATPPAVAFPAVVKPRCLSASRGVIRVNNRHELDVALSRLAAILSEPEVLGRFGQLSESVVIEDYVPGPEVAFDAVLIAGEVDPIAIFDKPRPLEGPHFAESLYVVPSQLSPTLRAAVIESTARAAAALGLREGPIHAELRLGAAEPVVIEIAARTIGGLCGRTLRLATGHSLAEIVLARICKLELEPGELEPAGVAMLAPTRAGIFFGMNGLGEARAIAGIDSIEITAPSRAGGRAVARAQRVPRFRVCARRIGGRRSSLR